MLLPPCMAPFPPAIQLQRIVNVEPLPEALAHGVARRLGARAPIDSVSLFSHLIIFTRRIAAPDKASESTDPSKIMFPEKQYQSVDRRLANQVLTHHGQLIPSSRWVAFGASFFTFHRSFLKIHPGPLSCESMTVRRKVASDRSSSSSSVIRWIEWSVLERGLNATL